MALKDGEVVTLVYTSNDVQIPPTFLTTTPWDAKPVTVNQIDFSTSTLSEYEGCYAVLLENVLSPSECAKLISLAEASVSEPDTETGDPWKPALVNAGKGREVLQSDYRNSDRIIWDQEEITKRLLKRCLDAEGMNEKLSTITGEQARVVISKFAMNSGEKWRLVKLNERMRFLRYGKGQFFKPHCDGAYMCGNQRTFYTVHFYFNDSKQVAGEDAELVGGATTFWSSNCRKRLDVDPKAGSVLIFQHRYLYHSGDYVLQGTKYTMRTDLLYELDKSNEA